MKEEKVCDVCKKIPKNPVSFIRNGEPQYVCVECILMRDEEFR
jgi:hypothetical protein